MLMIQHVQIRPSSPVDMCCLCDEHQQGVQSTSLVPPLPVLTLCCSCCVLGSSFSLFYVELCLWGKSSVFIRRLKMRYYLRKIKSWGMAQTMWAPVFSAVDTNQWKMSSLQTTVPVFSHSFLGLGIWEGLTGVLTRGLSGVCIQVVPGLGSTQRVFYPLPRGCA